MLREIVLERIRAVNEYVRRDVEGFEEEWLRCRRADWQASINDEKKRLENAKKRIADLDMLISRCYEDAVLGNLSRERYEKMTQGYKEEQERQKEEVETLEEWVENKEEMDGNMDSFLDVVQRYMDVPELTPINSYLWRSKNMKLSKIFEEKPERWGLRGDPYFWDYLKERAENMDIISPDELEKWIKEEYSSLSGKALTDEYMDFAVIEQFAHGGMSSGGVDNEC